jgi:hypothetical protein
MVFRHADYRPGRITRRAVQALCNKEGNGAYLSHGEVADKAQASAQLSHHTLGLIACQTFNFLLLVCWNSQSQVVVRTRPTLWKNWSPAVVSSKTGPELYFFS